MYNRNYMLRNVKNWFRKLLVRSQNYTGTDNIYIAKSGFWSSIPYLTSSMLSIAQVIVFANFLPKESYGTYKYILSAASAFGFLTLTGMNAAVTQMTSKGSDGILSYSVRLQLRFNALYTAAAVALSAYYWIHRNVPLSLGLLIIGVTFPINAALSTYGAYLSGKKDFRRAAQYGMFSNLFYSLLLITTTVLTKNVIAIVAAYALGSLLPVLFFYTRTERSLNASEPTSEEKRELATYGGHLSFLNILSTIGRYLDKIVLFHAAGAVQLAVYSLAQAVPDRVEGYFKSWNTILLPKLSERTTHSIRPVFYKRIGQSMIIGALVAAGYWLIAPAAFRLILPNYLDSVEYSRIIMLSFIFTMPAAYVSNVFRSQRVISVIYTSSIFGNLTLIALFLILGSLYGIKGLAWAQVIGHGIGTIFNCILWQWHLRRTSVLVA
jgi:O-antigen/teichoic acid export membrane protein